MDLEIRTVKTRAELKAFVTFPETMYADVPQWVPAPVFDDMNTLRKDKNPAFEFSEAEYWTAWRGGKMVGRIAGIINRKYIEKWGNAYARFGWVDFIEDFEVARALFDTVEAWAKSKGMVGIHGPLGFTDLDREGLLVEGFQERATFATIYNFPYYPEYIERLGYAKDVDWIEFLVQTPDSIPEKLLRVNEILAKRSGVRIAEWKTKRELISKYADQLFELLDEAYAGLYGTTPLSRRQVQTYIDQYLGFVDPRFTKILVDSEERLAGFAITLPNLSDALHKHRGRLLPFGWLALLRALKHPETVDMMLVAVRKEFVARGVVGLLMSALNKSAIENGVKYAETNPELETNIAVQGLWKDYPKRQHKRRRVYLKRL
ncbi:MAG TPA: GCN5 family acetyltransferase [Rectinemataceae bacterium]